MLSSSFDATIDLTPQPSLRAVKYLFALHVTLILLLLFAVQPGAPMIALAALFALSWFSLRRHPVFGYGPRALARLTWHAKAEPGHEWTLHDASGSYDATLLANSYVHPKLLVLNFRVASGRRRTRVLLGDEMDAELLRRLRARLSL